MKSDSVRMGVVQFTWKHETLRVRGRVDLARAELTAVVKAAPTTRRADEGDPVGESFGA